MHISWTRRHVLSECIIYNVDILNSSVNIVSDHKLDDLGSMSGRIKGFLLYLLCQTSSIGHPDSYPTTTGGYFPWIEFRLGVTLITHPI
jgi:hypothetical protein